MHTRARHTHRFNESPSHFILSPFLLRSARPPSLFPSPPPFSGSPTFDPLSAPLSFSSSYERLPVSAEQSKGLSTCRRGRLCSEWRRGCLPAVSRPPITVSLLGLTIEITPKNKRASTLDARTTSIAHRAWRTSAHVHTRTHRHAPTLSHAQVLTSHRLHARLTKVCVRTQRYRYESRAEVAACVYAADCAHAHTRTRNGLMNTDKRDCARERARPNA
eukprot:6192653-Pleurochrysis_carterae.AAC.4